MITVPVDSPKQTTLVLETVPKVMAPGSVSVSVMSVPEREPPAA